MMMVVRDHTHTLMRGGGAPRRSSRIESSSSMAYRDGGTAAQGVYKANHGRKQGIEDSEHFNSAQHARHIINVRERDLYLDSPEV